MKTLVFCFIRKFMPLALFFILTSVAANAATIRGRLVYSNGYPAAGAAVTVLNRQVGRSSPGYAGANGMYYLYNIPPGYYYLEVWLRPGAKPIVYQIQVLGPYIDIPPITVP